MASRPTFHPAVILLTSLAGAAAYAVWASSRFSGETLSSQYIYVVPIIVPFIAFLLDRAAEIRTVGFRVLVIDASVIIISILRARGYVPFVSGHVLFLTYAIVRRGSFVTRVTAALVMVETLYLKLFVWHDLVSPAGGLILALIAAALTQRLTNMRILELQTEGAHHGD